MAEPRLVSQWLAVSYTWNKQGTHVGSWKTPSPAYYPTQTQLILLDDSFNIYIINSLSPKLDNKNEEFGMIDPMQIGFGKFSES